MAQIVEEWQFIKKVTDDSNSNNFMYVLINAGVRGRILFEFDTTEPYKITDINFYVHSTMWYTKKVTQISSTLVLDLFLVQGNFIQRKKIQISNNFNKPGFDEFINDLMQCERDFIAAERENRGPGGAAGAGGAGGAAGGAGEEKSTALRF